MYPRLIRGIGFPLVFSADRREAFPAEFGTFIL
jgi:hypothetical protein